MYLRTCKYVYTLEYLHMYMYSMCLRMYTVGGCIACSCRRVAGVRVYVYTYVCTIHNHVHTYYNICSTYATPLSPSQPDTLSIGDMDSHFTETPSLTTTDSTVDRNSQGSPAEVPPLSIGEVESTFQNMTEEVRGECTYVSTCHNYLYTYMLVVHKCVHIYIRTCTFCMYKVYID